MEEKVLKRCDKRSTQMSNAIKCNEKVVQSHLTSKLPSTRRDIFCSDFFRPPSVWCLSICKIKDLPFNAGSFYGACSHAKCNSLQLKNPFLWASQETARHECKSLFNFTICCINFRFGGYPFNHVGDSLPKTHPARNLNAMTLENEVGVNTALFTALKSLLACSRPWVGEWWPEFISFFQ